METAGTYKTSVNFCLTDCFLTRHRENLKCHQEIIFKIRKETQPSVQHTKVNKEKERNFNDDVDNN
jgi:hypothetical protein